MLARTIEEKRMERVTGHPVYSSSYSPASLQLGDSYKRRVIYKDCTSRGRKWWAPARSTYIRRVIHPVVQFPPPVTLRVFGYSINPCQWERNHLQPFFEQQPPFYQVGGHEGWVRLKEKDGEGRVKEQKGEKESGTSPVYKWVSRLCVEIKSKRRAWVARANFLRFLANRFPSGRCSVCRVPPG